MDAVLEAGRVYLQDFPFYRQEGWTEPAKGSVPFLLFMLIWGAVVYVWEHHLNRRQIENFIKPYKSVPIGLDGVSLEVFKKSLVYGADKVSDLSCALQCQYYYYCQFQHAYLHFYVMLFCFGVLR